MMKKCLICKKEFKIHNKKAKYCSHKCYSKARQQGKYPLSGFQKGHPQFNTGKTYFKKGIKYGICFKKGIIPWNKNLKGFLAGSKHWNWQGGISPLADKIRKTKKYKKWRNSVYKQNYWTCQICQKKQRDNLIAHHKPPNTFSNLLKKYQILTLIEALNCKELWFTDYGITICRKCHFFIHKPSRWDHIKPVGQSGA